MNRFDGGSLRTVIKEQPHLFVLAAVLHSLAHKIQHRPSFQMQKVFRKKTVQTRQLQKTICAFSQAVF